MQYRKLGNTEIDLSVITFGAWAIGGWMWGGADRKEAVEAIRAAHAEGVTSIDTAPIYGQGTSEEIVAEAIKGIPRDKVQLLTKCGMRWDLTSKDKKGELAMKSEDNNGQPIEIYKYAGRDSVIKECEDSLRRLNTDYIDLYQLHWPDKTTPISETMEALQRLKEQGKIRAAGVCNYSLDQLKEAGQTIDIASDQVSYSMMVRDIEKDVIPYCLQTGKSVIAYSPLQRGLLTGKIKPGYHFEKGDTRADSRFYSKENIERVDRFLDELRPMAGSKGVTLAQLVLRWTIDQPGITVALAGARNAGQAVQNAHAAEVSLSPQEIDFINQKILYFDSLNTIAK